MPNNIQIPPPKDIDASEKQDPSKFSVSHGNGGMCICEKNCMQFSLSTSTLHLPSAIQKQECGCLS